MGRWAAIAACLWYLPLGAAAQGSEAGSEASDAEEPCGTAICGEDDAGVSGGPLDLSKVGKADEAKGPSSPGFDEGAKGWGIREHRLRVAPAGSEVVEPDPGDLPEVPKEPWPGRHQLHDWDFVKAHSYPELTRSVALEAFTFVGGDGHDHPVFAERVRANLYVIETGVTFFNSLDGSRDNETDMDLDARIPFTLGRHHQLAILPGVSFPIDSRDWRASDTNVRVQAIYGFATDGFALQLRGGFIQGSRRAGLLKLRERVDQPASLYGALLAWRFVPAVQLRAEASGEISTDGGPDRISILPGVNFFPLGDPRVSVGATAIIETSARRLSFDHASYGGLLNVGVGFI